jgi:N-acylneuraminate cytidylyltransferase
MIIKDEIWAFIPARSGSKSIKNKNIKKFCGKPLIYYTFKILSNIKNIKKIIFSTDSMNYIKIAKKFGIKFLPHIRSKKTSRDLATDLEVFQEFIKNEKKKRVNLPEFFLHLRPTTPFRKPEVVNKAIQKFFKIKNNYTAMRSISKLSNTGFRTLILKKKTLVSMFGKNKNMDKLNIARQNFPNTFIANGYVDIIKTKLLEQNKIHGNKVYGLLTEGLNSDIDTLEDFNNLETILKNNEHFQRYFFHSRNRNKS